MKCFTVLLLTLVIAAAQNPTAQPTQSDTYTLKAKVSVTGKSDTKTPLLGSPALLALFGPSIAVKANISTTISVTILKENYYPFLNFYGGGGGAISLLKAPDMNCIYIRVASKPAATVTVTISTIHLGLSDSEHLVMFVGFGMDPQYGALRSVLQRLNSLRLEILPFE